MEIKMSELELFDELLELFAKFYNHPECTQELKDYIDLETRRFFKPGIDIRSLLNKNPK